MFETQRGSRFARDYGSTVADWLRGLPQAVGAAPLQFSAGDGAWVALAGGRLDLRWQVLPARCIGMVRLPRLLVQFDFVDVDAGSRETFMCHFDRVLLRGGG